MRKPNFGAIVLAAVLLPALALITTSGLKAQDDGDQFNRSVLPITQKPFGGKTGLRTA